ncbi:hypothetical protein ACFYKX_04225 [Cytobacillus sp. FJAT-54145]|uniref:DUF4830 domain-containing protein n=1 Tax=Cytobacillus spartinae TaxID=3299023 RepID=A0ABW6KA59_9BACI
MRRLMIITFMIMLIPGLLWFLFSNEDEHMKSLLLHQPIDVNEVHIAKVFTSGKETDMKEEELQKIISWFNEYPADRVTEQPDFDYSAQSSGVMATLHVELNSKGKIKIFLVKNDAIYVARNDVKGGMMISYSFLDPSEELVDYFKRE